MRKKRALKNTIISILLQVILVISGFIIPKLIIQNYGSTVNGLVSSITQFLRYIVLLESGIGPVIRASLYKPLSTKNNKEIVNILYASERFFRKIAYVFLIYIVLLCMLYPLIIQSDFDSFFTISLIIIISISMFGEYYFGMTYKMFLRANQESYIISYIQIITTILNVIFTYILIKCGFNIQIVKLVSSLVFVLRPLLQFLYVRKKYNYDLSKADKNYQLKQKWDGLSQHIAAVIHDNTDVAVLSIFSTLINVSIYSVYIMILNGIKNFVDALTNGIDSAFGDMIAKNENQKLNNAFIKYENIYFLIITVVFSCTLYLISPFVVVYTKDITDANYFQPLFGYILVIAELIYVIRIPYNTLVLSAGLFKEMRKGSWIEAFSNLFISIILVSKYGLIGIAIGTALSMLYRTVDFIKISSKKILMRDYKNVIKKIVMLLLNIIMVGIVNGYIHRLFIMKSYFNWISYASIIFVCSATFAMLLELLIEKKSFLKSIKL